MQPKEGDDKPPNVNWLRLLWRLLCSCFSALRCAAWLKSSSFASTITAAPPVHLIAWPITLAPRPAWHLLLLDKGVNKMKEIGYSQRITNKLCRDIKPIGEIYCSRLVLSLGGCFLDLLEKSHQSCRWCVFLCEQAAYKVDGRYVLDLCSFDRECAELLQWRVVVQ